MKKINVVSGCDSKAFNCTRNQSRRCQTQMTPERVIEEHRKEYRRSQSPYLRTSTESLQQSENRQLKQAIGVATKLLQDLKSQYDSQFQKTSTYELVVLQHTITSMRAAQSHLLGLKQKQDGLQADNQALRQEKCRLLKLLNKMKLQQSQETDP